MDKRFQIFVSSTYEDLKVERQHAVQAILACGHIPAGMELFSAGDESQMDVIRRWIEQSDIFLVIQGPRYGSIEPKGGISYVESELNYAEEIGKPFFAVLMEDSASAQRLSEIGMTSDERKNGPKYERFRSRLRSKMSSFFSTPTELENAIFRSLPPIIASKNLTGWVRANSIAENVAESIAKLTDENRALKEEVDTLTRESLDRLPCGLTFDEGRDYLQKKMTFADHAIPGTTSNRNSVLMLMTVHSHRLGAGVSAPNFASDYVESFLYENVAPELSILGLMDQGDGVFTLNEKGKRFIARNSLLKYPYR